MRHTFRLVALSLLILSGFTAAHAESAYISETRYDWSGVANSITSASKPDYEKARDIYNWITRNIAYDTSYTIRTADATYENQRGVCQGYSELFYRIAEAVGLRCDIIFGKSKDHEGKIDDIGHAWLFVYTNGNSGILVDPTWGAGPVSNGRFISSPTDKWFHADPAFMIFTHFPDDPQYQLLPSPISFETFRGLPHFDPSLSKYGYNGSEILAEVLAGRTPSVPSYYSSEIDSHATGIKVPMEGELRIGTDYEFYVLPKARGKEFCIINGDDFCTDWVSTDRQTAVRYMPHTPGRLNVAVKTPDGKYTTLISYKVAAPTAEETARLEAAHPLRSARLKNVEGFDLRRFEKLGVDGKALLAAVKSENIRRLPTIYGGSECRPVKVPWNGRLRAGQSYTFTITPGDAQNFASINNENWGYEWKQDPSTGLITLTTAPLAPGRLVIASQKPGATSFNFFMEYTVE